MPRDLPVGNGSLLVNFDATGTLRDVYYPRVGQENHTDGYPSHFGVWVADADGASGQFAWLSDDGWERSLTYRHETLITNIHATHAGLALALYIEDAVDFDRNVYIRKVVIENQAKRDRIVRVFFQFNAHLWSTNVGDTGYYDPRSGGLVFYKATRYFLLNARSGDHVGLHQWAVGQKEVAGKEGTWRDAEDGQLSGNPVAQGSIDGTGGMEVRVPAGKQMVLHWWLAAGESVGVVGDLDKRMRERNPDTYRERTDDYWRLWVNKEPRTYADLPAPVRACFNQSLLVLRTNIDKGGAIIAANDADILQFGRDTYTYMWPRDGALVALALIRAGYSDVSRQFFRFIESIITHDGYLLHKYNPDGSMGSTWHPFIAPDGTPQLPIQEDETALVIAAMWEHFRNFREIEFITPLYRPLVRAAAEFMVGFREPHTRLPAPSYDLWEERHGIMAWTVASVWAGLRAAANFADAFGQKSLAHQWHAAADEIRHATDMHLFDATLGRFVRMVNVDKDGTVHRDPTMDMSIVGLTIFGMYSPHDPRIVATMQAAEELLHVRTDVGGYARYENDYYHQVSQDIKNCPGNPWFICALWMADYAIAAAKSVEDLMKARDLIVWVADHALPSGVLAEQVHPYTGAPLSVSPLTWSHAAFITTVQVYVGKYSELTTSIHAPGTTHLGSWVDPHIAPHAPMQPAPNAPIAPVTKGTS